MHETAHLWGEGRWRRGGHLHVAHGGDTRDGAPVELDRRADAVRAAAEHHRRLGGAVLGLHRHVGLLGVVRHVHVVGLCRELSGERVDLLDEGRDALSLAPCADCHVVAAHRVGDLRVGEALLLGMAEHVIGHS